MAVGAAVYAGQQRLCGHQDLANTRIRQLDLKGLATPVVVGEEDARSQPKESL